jgi:glycosyltransferase involved in cell wall biosynthesis
MVDTQMDLADLFRESRKLLKESVRDTESSPEGFDRKAKMIFEVLDNFPEDSLELAHVTAEVLPRLFAADVASGYAFFHNEEIIMKMWRIYNRVTKIIAGDMDLPQVQHRNGPPYKTACITSLFSCHLAPTKALIKLANDLDRNLFEPIVICTNQFQTIRRERREQPELAKTETAMLLAQLGIELVSIPEQESIEDLSRELVRICAEKNIDIVIANASPFSFPEACLAVSGVPVSFFDFHRGFPLYVDGVDAILHWISGSRESQLRPWLDNGGKVIDYKYMIDIPPRVTKPEHDDQIVMLITCSNHLESRLSPEFCQTVNRIMLEFPQTCYQFIGGGHPDKILNAFDPAVRSRINFLGPVKDENMMFAYFVNADIYLNEFPVGGSRSVLEAMSACLPVITMVCGELPVEKAGAEYVGDEIGIMDYEPGKYFSLAKELILSKEKRIAVGDMMRQRIEEYHDSRKVIKTLALEMLNTHQAKLALKSME